MHSCVLFVTEFKERSERANPRRTGLFGVREQLQLAQPGGLHLDRSTGVRIPIAARYIIC